MIEKLEQEVVEWAEQKGIFAESDSLRQMTKMLEEADELDKAVFHKEIFPKNLNAIQAVEDELGDVLVTCVIQAKFHDLSLQSCLQKALTKITKRTGRMVDGTFVKDTH